ncbi:hypothetical protein CI109_103723 [Kwoniella shandongensis]|uniref:NAD-dependent epimerase/dehydratase domain-containing protein n=1 Tax=Kwoniella shandongensis TaxID=1734106 RepID=A0AAJ8MVS1_9TREE
MIPIHNLIASLRKPRFLAVILLIPLFVTLLYRRTTYQDSIARPRVQGNGTTQGGSWAALVGLSDSGDGEAKSSWGKGVGDWLNWNKDAKKKKAILITGGAGQLGQAIIPKLIDEYNIHIFDIAPRPSTMSKSVTYHRGSFSPSDTFHSLLSSTPFAGVVHLAGISLDAWCSSKEEECLEVNAGSTELLMDYVTEQLQRTRKGSSWEAKDAPWVILGSSMEVFGDEGSDEESERKPTTALGRTKLAAEKVIEDAFEWQSSNQEEPSGLHAIIARFSQVYGYSQESWIPEAFIPSLLFNSLTSLPIQYSSNTLSPDLVYVTDAVDGMLKAITELGKQSTNDDPNELESVNFVTESRRSTQDIVELVRTETHSMSPVRDIGDHHTPQAPKYSAARALEVLGWKPKISLPSGLGLAVTQLSEEIATYSRKYLHDHCAPSLDFQLPQDQTVTEFVEDERNRDLTKLDGCTVNMGFDHDGWLHHVKCEDGKHCTADGQKVPTLNWNQSVFIVRKVMESQPKDRTVRVVFEEEKGMGYLGIGEKNGKEVGLELFKDANGEAQIQFDVEVKGNASYLRLLIPDAQEQLHAVANTTDDSTWFSLEPTMRWTQPHFDLRMTVLCCPSEGDWPLLLDDCESLKL